MTYRLSVAVLCLAISAKAAFAGAASTPTNYQPDTALKRASRGELEVRIRKA